MKTGISHRLLVGLIACLSLGISGAQDANPLLPTTKIQAGIHVITAELAADVGTRQRGLMHRTKLENNHGMLFVFERASQQCFWMRNTLIPLSIAFLAEDGRIVNIADMQPQSDDSHCSNESVRLALEMDKGWFAKRGIKAGTKLKLQTEDTKLRQ
jgi:uncharacterized protein